MTVRERLQRSVARLDILLALKGEDSFSRHSLYRRLSTLRKPCGEDVDRCIGVSIIAAVQAGCWSPGPAPWVGRQPPRPASPHGGVGGCGGLAGTGAAKGRIKGAGVRDPLVRLTLSQIGQRSPVPGPGGCHAAASGLA